MTLCKGEEGLHQQLVLYHVYDNFCLPHASLRQPLSQPLPTNGTGSATQWRPCTPAMAAGLTDLSGACEKSCSFACRRGRSQWGCEPAVVMGSGKVSWPEQATCVRTAGCEGVTRGERATGRP